MSNEQNHPRNATETNSRINEILIILREMLQELSESELGLVERYIEDECSETDDDIDHSNMFRTFICDPWYDLEEINSWNPRDD